MLKKLSIRMKITLWFSAILIAVVALTYFVILSVSRQTIQKTIRDTLITAVENNVDEIEYYDSLCSGDAGSDVDYYMRYESGYIEIDDDFLDEVNDIFTSLCQSDGTLLYGENPIMREAAGLDFLDSEVQRITVNGTLYYVFDRKLEAEGLEDLWLRGVVSETQGETELSAISRTSLILLPSLVLLAIIGGWLIARRALDPIREISDTAARIRQGNDLKQRVAIGEGNDELHHLADQFNEMFTRLDDSFQAEQQFVSDASHELRTPVSVINAQCELTLEEPHTPAEYEEALNVIWRQGKKMSRLIRDMLDFTRLELQPERYANEEFDLTALVEGVCYDMALIQENAITLTCEAEADISICGNQELMTRLLTNLISNAYRYGKAGGFIKVRLYTGTAIGFSNSSAHGRSTAIDFSNPSAHGRSTDSVSLRAPENGTKSAPHPEQKNRMNASVILSVQDNGIGIAEKDLLHIFRRFYQADASRSGKGNGLGLAMVKEIAAYHNGEITVESTPGEGSTFTLVLHVFSN
ncbi:MAG: HAMP domain-containing histidine kinase [Lachnospiraceae bacterium]|nr:HAMP domain-containing histidine kinase [Lachnospiraceae bacterium]